MTTRPPLGSHRPPQSSLNGNGQAGPKPQSLRDFSSTQIRRTEERVDLGTDGESPHGLAKNAGSKLALSRSASTVGSPNTAEAVFKQSRGRPRLQFDTHPLQIKAEDGTSSPIAPDLSDHASPLPMPVRPGRHNRPTVPKQRTQPSSTTRKETRPKPYTLEVPATAPHYPPNGHADFFPWTGNHPEDKLNDGVIRNGYFDKSATQNETGSARASIYPALKQKTGLQTLSSLFVAVLDQRRAHGQITSASTFKPPPRVTLTDTKRETWLRDLANPSISLRRLSRTIPHGIRGKILLEQCLSKNIPTERAVWLAKCVGANEIRASKRKGVSGTFALGGEAKWIRDWTGFVESFVESIINSCGERDWKDKIGYAFRFAAHLHSEHLLDRDHYLDWLSSSLENCSLTSLPIWLLNTQIYWSELLQYRKHGRRIATALLGHLHNAHTDPDGDILSPIITRLVGLIDDLIIKHSENFVSPTTWTKYGLTLQACMETDDPLRSNVFKALDLRNSRLTITPIAEKELSPRRQLIQLFDTSNLEGFSRSLIRQAWELSQDKAKLVRTLLEWATSLHRSGVAKVYIGARVLRKWSEFGIDITTEILAFLDMDACEFRRCKQSLYHLVCELTRSGHFSPARYIQWLIAGGRLREAADVEKYGPYATRLLAEIPTHALSTSIETLRKTLLARVGFSVDEEEEAIQLTMETIDRQPELQNLPMSDGQTGDEVGAGAHFSSFADLSWTIKSEIGLWLRKRVGSHKTLRTFNKKEWGPMATSDQISAVTLTEYQTLNHILESIEDFSMYADILKIITTSDNPEVLAAVTDTLNMHLEKFVCIGALQDLFDSLHIRLRMLNLDHTRVTRKFLLSLSDLAARVSDRQDIEKQLAQEVIQSDRKGAVDACSPVSDHMVEVLQNAEVDFADEIEKVLESGNTMDHATHDRLFQTIISRLEACERKSPEQQRSCGELLLKLKSFDCEHFGFLIRSWLSQLLCRHRTLGLAHSLAPLISNGCLSLKTVHDACSDYLAGSAAEGNKHASIGIAHDSLTLLLGMAEMPEAMNVTDIQRYKIHTRNMQKDYPKQALSIIKYAIEWIMASSDERGLANDLELIRDEFRRNCNDSKMMDLLRNLIVADAGAVKTQLFLPLIQRSNDEINNCLQLLLDHLLLPSTSGQRVNLDMKTRVEKTLQISDDITTPFCQLQLVFQASTAKREENNQILLTALAEAIETAATANSMAWTSILPSLDSSTASHLCEQAESLFISLLPTTKAKNLTGLSESVQSHAADIMQARNFLEVIEATSFTATKSSRALQFSAQIVDKLSDIWNILVSRSDHFAVESDCAVSEQSLDLGHQEEAENSLLLLLRLITIHAQSPSSFGISSTPTSSLTPSQEQSRSGNIQDKSMAETRARLLLHLISLLHIFQIRQNTRMVLMVFDVAILLVDEYISEESRSICVKAVKDRMSDGRVRYLLGYGEADMDWLFLCQKVGGGLGSGKSGERMGEGLKRYDLKPWEMLSEPTPNVGENDTSLSLVLFGARR